MLKQLQRPINKMERQVEFTRGKSDVSELLVLKRRLATNVSMASVKNYFLSIKSRLQEDSFDSLLWLVNLVPSIAGFSIRRDKIKAPFWCIHLAMLFYIYGVGLFVFQWKYAQDFGDFVKSYVNVSILILITNNSWWFMTKRPLIKSLLKKIEANDGLSRGSSQLQMKHKKMIGKIKQIIMIFYSFNCINAVFVYLPKRVDVLNNYSMTPCVGMEPLSSSPNREICLTILFLQEISIMVVVLNYQTLFLFLVAHTAVMYQMLADELLAFNDFEDLAETKLLAREKLPSLIERHSLTIDVISNMKTLYSVPLGVNFGSNAICMSFFFFLPLQEWLMFMPIVVYCFLVFFLYCFLCQRLINASEVFERSLYCCGWENFELREKKIIYLMLTQAQKPVELLAADIIPVNIYTFATTLQAMYKFVTVVKF